MTRCGDGADVEWFLGVGDVGGGGDGEHDEYTELCCELSLPRRLLLLLERVSLTLSATSLTSKTPSFSKRARAVLKRASWLSVRTTETTGAVPPPTS